MFLSLYPNFFKSVLLESNSWIDCIFNITEFCQWRPLNCFLCTCVCWRMVHINKEIKIKYRGSSCSCRQTDRQIWFTIHNVSNTVTSFSPFDLKVLFYHLLFWASKRLNKVNNFSTKNKKIMTFFIFFFF